MYEACGYPITIRGHWLRIARLGGEKFRFLEGDPAQVVAELRGSKERIDIFTFMEGALHTAPRFAYPVEWDNLAVLEVSTFDHWWRSQVDAKTRNMVRRAEKKGVETREVPFTEDLVRGIAKIYNETPFRQGKPFPHYGKSFSDIYREEATYLEESVFVGAFSNGVLIGFIKILFDASNTHGGLLNIASLVGERDKAPNNALLAHAVRVCAERRTRFLTYSNLVYGNKEEDTLAHFKKNNGFQRIDLPRYYVPLTFVGRTALQLGLHKSLLEIIPRPLIEGYRRIRNARHERMMKRTTSGNQLPA